MKSRFKLLILLLALTVLFTGCSLDETGSGISSTVKLVVVESPTPAPTETPAPAPTPVPTAFPVDLTAIPAYAGSPYTEVNANVPYFSENERTTVSFESYAELDSLGRCGTAYACVGVDIMPTEERGEIGMIKPSGWQTVRYDDLIDGMYLYNRCHLIGYQLSGENANKQNLNLLVFLTVFCALWEWIFFQNLAYPRFPCSTDCCPHKSPQMPSHGFLGWWSLTLSTTGPHRLTRSSQGQQTLTSLFGTHCGI